MLEIGLYPLICIPMKYNPGNTITKYSILDQIWTNVPTSVLSSYVIPIEIADHFPVAAFVDLTDRIKEGTLLRRDFNHENNLLFTSIIISDDMNKTFDFYNSKVLDACKKFKKNLVACE